MIRHGSLGNGLNTLGQKVYGVFFSNVRKLQEANLYEIQRAATVVFQKLLREGNWYSPGNIFTMPAVAGLVNQHRLPTLDVGVFDSCYSLLFHLPVSTNGDLDW